MTSKYDRLTQHLSELPNDRTEITFTFQELESILGFKLPKSAIDYRPWWANQSDSKNRPQAHAWASAGFKVDSVQLKKPGGWVRFKRAVGHGARRPEIAPPKFKVARSASASNVLSQRHQKKASESAAEFKLKFPEAEIPTLANRYSYARKEKSVLDIREAVRKSGYLTKGQLKTVGLWKAPRAAGHIDKNDADFAREMTSLALSARSERARIEILTVIDGVQWPTASVILHLFHRDPYPILDFRALWSVGLGVPKVYTFEFWWPYVEYCRAVARRNNVDMRTLDRALWQFSKENREPGSGVVKPQKPDEVRGPKSEPSLTKKAAERSHPKTFDPQNLEGTVYWVSCVSKKQATPTEAKDLYVSDWFSKARAYVEATGAEWFILSAMYGLVSPEQVIAPYDLTLNKMPIADRRRWAEKVFGQIADQKPGPKNVVMLAGARYREFLEPRLRAMGIEVDVPMEGLRIGEQLSWLNQPAKRG